MSFIPHLAVTAAIGLSTPFLTLASSDPVPGELALVVAPPWVDKPALVAGASGALVGPEVARWGALARADAPGFAADARRAGAWFVVNGRSLALFCGGAA